MMVCDKCHDDTGGFQAKLKDGTVLCAKCLKVEKNGLPKNVPTKDKFIILCRKLSKLAPNSHQWVFKVIALAKGGRCYTNSNILISDVDDVPEGTEMMDLSTLESRNEKHYVGVSKVIPKTGPHYVDIPEIVYKLLTVFKNTSERNARVVFHNGEITVEDTESETSMQYTDVDMNNPDPLALSIPRLLLLKPKRIEFDNNSEYPVVTIPSSYDKTVDSFKHVVLAGMKI